MAEQVERGEGWHQLHKKSLDDQDENNLSTRTLRPSTPTNRDLSSASSDHTNVADREPTTPVAIASLQVQEPPMSPLATDVTSNSPRDSVFDLSSVSHFKRPKGGSCRHSVLQKAKLGIHRTTRKNIGIVIGDFKGIYPDELSLTVGGRIEIMSKDTVVSRNIGWWTGKNDKGMIGIFPAACVKVVSSVSDPSDVSVQSEFPLEIHNSEIEMKEVIGIGGFGKVFRAMYRGEEVAVKIAKTTTFDSLKAVQEVISEAEKFSHLAHDNICALVGVVLVKDVCLVMEYARGGALSEVLHKKPVSLPVSVILDWSTQIASGMNYLHYEANPSLIHRDLKSSNILLAYPIDPQNPKDNVIKITDFGLAREIEHTTHMSGAGTYPWMAPEVIRSSDFSKKSDVWSYAVVLWELLTGEKPYGGLDLFVVAYGVGHGSLCLPIPDGCPLEELMNNCWERLHTERPSFSDVLETLNGLKDSAFFVRTSDETFRSIQSSWKEEIHKRFADHKIMERELKSREEELYKRICQQDQRQLELDKAHAEIQQRAEALEQMVKDLKHVEIQETTDRPPRLQRFTLKSFMRRILGQETDKKSEGPLPSKTVLRPRTERSTSSEAPRKQSFNSPSPRRQQPSPSPKHGSKRSSLPINSLQLGHRRQHSDGNREDIPSGNLLTPYEHQRSVPSSPGGPGQQGQPHRRPSPTFLARKLDDTRLRSWSDLRSPSPQQSQQLLHPHVSPPPAKATSTSSLQQFHQPPPLHTKSQKQFSLKFHSRTSQDSSSPSSPNVTITPAEDIAHVLGFQQCDSGNNSMTCSDASGHSNSSELIKLDSPVEVSQLVKRSGAFCFVAAEFDPLRQSISHDSLLFDPYSGNTSPNVLSTSPNTQTGTSPKSSSSSQTSPKQSLNTTDEGTLNIVRKRPQGLPLATPDPMYPISAPSSRPRSARSSIKKKGRNVSPTGSVQSLITYPTNYEQEAPYMMSDSDATSTTSSLLDVRLEDDPFPLPLIPMPDDKYCSSIYMQ